MHGCEGSTPAFVPTSYRQKLSSAGQDLSATWVRFPRLWWPRNYTQGGAKIEQYLTHMSIERRWPRASVNEKNINKENGSNAALPCLPSTRRFPQRSGDKSAVPALHTQRISLPSHVGLALIIAPQCRPKARVDSGLSTCGSCSERFTRSEEGSAMN